MSKRQLWRKGGKLVTTKGRLMRCKTCPCGGFPGWIHPENKYMFYEYRDWDCCRFGSASMNEGGFSGVDGHVTFMAISPTKCKVVESTGNYSNYRVGSEYGLAGGGYPSPFVMTSTIISDTRRLSSIRDGNCCNADGQRIYAVMWNEDDEEDFE
ncbi:MAG: hypothetical protein IJU70_12065 [Lentisphaeria bacterium]|nr:hypothetical protein [Lentisphaeria bacterium]